MDNEIAKSVAKNTTIQMVQQLITWSSSFVLMLFLPRLLGPENYGALFLGMSVAGIFSMFVIFDGRIGVAKRIARDRDEASKIVTNALGMRVMFWCVSFAAMMLFGYIVKYPPMVKALLLIFGLEMLWGGLHQVFLGTFLGFESVQFSSVGAIVERVFISLAGVTALLLGVGTIGIALIMISGTLLNFLLCARFIRRFIGRLQEFDWSVARRFMREGIPYLLWTIFGVVYYRVDSVMLSLMAPPVVVGWYGAAYKFFDMLVFLPSIYSLSILPVLSKLWGKQDDLLALTTRKSIEFIMLAGIPISVFVYFFSPPIVGFFFGLSGYAASVINLQIFGVGLLLVYVDMVLATALMACDRQRQMSVVAFCAIPLNIVLNYFLIPLFQQATGNGGIGAAIATIATEYAVMMSALSLFPRGILDGSAVPVSLKALAGGAVMVLAIWMMRQASIFWGIEVIVGAGLYLLVLLKLRTFSYGELSFMRKFLSVHNLRSIFVLGKEING